MLGMGAPLIANYQSALFYPPTWLYFLFAAVGGLPLMAWGQALLVSAHLALAGWGMLRLLRKLGLAEFAQTVGALAFSLSGYLVARAHFLSINAAAAWLPWILLAAYELAANPRSWRAALKLAAFFALQWLAGHAQISWYTLLLTIAWLIFWARQHKSSFAPLAGPFVFAGLLAFCLSAVQLLPTLEYLLQSQRAAQYDSAAAMAYSFWPWRLIGLVAPNFFGNPALGNYQGYANFWEDAIYVGLPPLLLAVGALFGAEKRRSLMLFLVGLAVVSLLFALGSNLAIFPWLFDHVPTFNLFQGPTRFSLWLVFAASLLAALGAQKLRPPQGRALYWARLSVAGAIAILGACVLAFALNVTGRLPIPQPFIPAVVSAGLIALAISLLYLRLPLAESKRKTWTLLACLLLALDLLYAGWGLNPAASLELYKTQTVHSTLASQLNGARLYMPAAYEDQLKFDLLFRFDTFNSEDPRTIRASLLPNISILDSIPSANNFDPLVPARYANWIAALESASPEDRASMLAAMNVGAVATLIEGQGASLEFETLPASGRVSFATCLSPVFDVDCASADATVRIARETPNSLVVEVDAPADGWVVIADTWYPGWHARVSNSPAQIDSQYGVFRAIPVRAGNSTVGLEYRPLSFTIGLLLTSLAWPALAVIWKRSR